MYKKIEDEKLKASWPDLIREFNLCIEQAARARAAGHDSIADGVLKRAGAILRKIRDCARLQRQEQLAQRRYDLSARLHQAVAAGQSNEADALSYELAALDKQIEAA